MRRKMKLTIKKLGLIALVTAFAFGLINTPASAREIEQNGNCSAGSIFQADMELEYRVWDLSFDVETKTANQNWKFTLKQNGKSVYTNTRQAISDFDDNYAEVEWDVIRPDRSNKDRFQFVAKNATTGEVCRVTLRE